MAENIVDTYTLQKCYDYIDTKTEGFTGDYLPKIFVINNSTQPSPSQGYYTTEVRPGDICRTYFNSQFSFWYCVDVVNSTITWQPLQNKMTAGAGVSITEDGVVSATVSKLLTFVGALPETGDTNTLYLVVKSDPVQGDEFEEYVWLGNRWERIGSLSLDLTDYYTKEQVDIITGERKGQLELENGISTSFSTIGVSSLKITGSTPAIYPGPNTFKYATQQEGPWNFITFNTELDVSNYNTIYLKYTKEGSSSLNTLNVNLSYILSNHFVRKNELDNLDYASKTYVNGGLSSLSQSIATLNSSLQNLTTRVGTNENNISSLQTAVSNKQDRLTAGNNIEINGQGVISVVGITPTSTAPQFEKITEVEIQSSTTTPLTWTDTNEETEYDDIFIVCRSFKGSGNLKVDIATTKDKSSTGKFTIFNQTNALTSGGSAIFIENERLTEDTFKCDYKIGITPNVTGVQGKNYVVGNSSPTISNKIYSVEVNTPSGATSGTIELYGKKKF